MKKIKAINYINGKFLPADKSFVSVMDIGLLRGFGVFDFMVTYNNLPFLLNEHIDRLFHSAGLIGLVIGKSKDGIKNIVVKTLKKNTWKSEKTVRIVVTGGVGNSSTEQSIKPTIIVIVEPKHDYPDEYYKNGVSVFTYDYVRPLAHAKSLEYAKAIAALQISRKKGGVESIYYDGKSKNVSEATTSNLFIVKNGSIVTSDENVLNGVTRDLVLKLLKKKFKVSERKVKLSELYSADEIFMTASNKEIMPVVAVDKKKIGNGKVGILTKEVMNIFRDFVVKGNW